MENNNQTNTTQKNNPIVLIILVILIIAIVGYGVWQSTNKKDNKQNETTTISTTVETTESTTEPTTQTTTTTTETTTKKRELDTSMMYLLSNSQWVNKSGETYLVLYDGTMEYTDSNYTVKDSMLYSIYAREDNKYDFKITYKNGKTETYIMSPDFSYDGELLHYDLSSSMNLNGKGKFSEEWIFLTYFG
ncbi:MAG: hypothetical protein ACLUFN_02330 [Eubacterium sp.]